jgi:hypothetical protein
VVDGCIQVNPTLLHEAHYAPGRQHLAVRTVIEDHIGLHRRAGRHVCQTVGLSPGYFTILNVGDDGAGYLVLLQKRGHAPVEGSLEGIIGAGQRGSWEN